MPDQSTPAPYSPKYYPVSIDTLKQIGLGLAAGYQSATDCLERAQSNQNGSKRVLCEHFYNQELKAVATALTALSLVAPELFPQNGK
jgi:hypothetical protein